jgi:REP element-mobilizing transposase RayT
VTARGNERREIFRTDPDRQRFLALVSELKDRFRIGVHAFVLMDNHYHVLVRTREANLNHAVRWLNVSYAVWYNWKHRRVGHLFQGRYRAEVIEDVGGVSEVARYIHLNPVRTAKLGLSKAEQARQKTAAARDAGDNRVGQRLKVLGEYPWSSWQVYGGAQKGPAWLDTSVVSAACGGRSRKQQREALRRYTEAPLREGRLESPWDRLVGGLVLGSREYAQELLKDGRVDREQQTSARRLERGRVEWKELVGGMEKARGMSWPEMCRRHGDWGRDAVLYVAVHYGGYRLVEAVALVPGLKYAAAAQGITRFRQRLKADREAARVVAAARDQLSKI